MRIAKAGFILVTTLFRCITYAVPVLVAAVSAGQDTHSRLRLSQTIPLVGETFHVQGIDVDGSRLWVTAVDRTAKRGWLFEYKLPEGRPVRSIEIQDGDRFHPGGMMADGDSLWIPVAEYKKESTAIIQRRNKQSLALEFQFKVDDHIGAVAVTPEGIVGANWDARSLYVWDRFGKQIRKVPNPSEVAFQDMKFENGELIGSGLLPDKSGVIIWMDWPSLRVNRRIAVGRTDRGIAYTQEGMAIRKQTLWLLPEDSKSRLFLFSLAQ
jgi:uncharacterized protein DUF6454